MKIDQRILGEVLSAARQEQGLSHKELANIVCLSKWHIKELEEEAKREDARGKTQSTVAE